MKVKTEEESAICHDLLFKLQIGSQGSQKLRYIEKEERYSLDPPPVGRYLTSGPALLIGLLKATNELRSRIAEESRLVKFGENSPQELIA
jgi:hypothetical protein